MKKICVLALAISVALTASACTGLSLGESSPGGSEWLEPTVVETDAMGNPTGRSHGALAVDPRTENVFVMQTTGSYAELIGSRPEPGELKMLHSIDPNSGRVQTVSDVSELADVRIVFPKDGVMVLGEGPRGEEIRMLNADTFEPRWERTTDAHYNGLRLSGRRRYIAAADNPTNHRQDSPNLPIHIIDSLTSEIAVVPSDGLWLEAQWANQNEHLITISFENPFVAVGSSQEDRTGARIRRWDLSDGFDQLDWTTPNLDIELPSATADLFFSFTWVAIHPQDTHAAFPVIRIVDTEEGGTDSLPELAIVNLSDGSVRNVPDAKGPVAFTPDGSTIVSYRNSAADDSELLLIDLESLEQRTLRIPHGAPSFFLSDDGHHVVVGNSFGTARLLMYDVEDGSMTELDGPEIDLNEFARRPEQAEMWLVDDGLFRLDLMSGTLNEVQTGFTPSHINILPVRDMLVLDEQGTMDIHFFSPITQETTRTVSLPVLMSAG